MRQFQLLVISFSDKTPLPALGEELVTQVIKATEFDQRDLAISDYDLLVINADGKQRQGLEALAHCQARWPDLAIPTVLYVEEMDLQDRLQALELGVDDILLTDTSEKELQLRLNKAIFNKIANDQLKNRLEQANQTAFAVMNDASKLGLNIQFLLEVNKCDNLDELGQLFFATLEQYGLHASVQMRSQFEVKNMEANGMAKELESQLLTQMKDAGRYYDFGSRTICNYGTCSILIKNMPVDDPNRYGAIKDNTFALVQGMDARVKAIDAQRSLQQEKQMLQEMSREIHKVMERIDSSYHEIMCNIVTVVEDMSTAIDQRIPNLALSEEQERFFEEVTESCVQDTNRVFNEGLKVDHIFRQLLKRMRHVIDQQPGIEQQRH